MLAEPLVVGRAPGPYNRTTPQPLDIIWTSLSSPLSRVLFFSRRTRLTEMRYATRSAAAVGVVTAASLGSIVGEAFLAAPLCFHAAAATHHHHNNNNNNDINEKLRFAAATSSTTAMGARSTTTTSTTTATARTPRSRRKHVLARCASVEMQASSSLRWTPPPPAAAAAAAAAVPARSSRPGHARRRARATAPCCMSAAADAGEGGDEGVLGPLRPLSPTEDGSDVFNPNPLARNDPERARVNDLITILAGTPMAEWKPAVIDEYMESLLKHGLFRQAMNERLAKVRSGEEREALARVDSYMTGFLSHEWRKASRKKVSVILGAAAEGPMELDDCVQTLGKADLLDNDLTEYVASLITAEERKCVKSVLLKVLKTVRDRIQAELRTGARPEIRTLARALAIEDGAQRKDFLQKTLTKLEELDEFVKFVEEGIDYLGDDFGFAVRTNMPQEHFDKMKAVYAETSAMRRKYLQ